jgi:hypothetical protein
MFNTLAVAGQPAFRFIHRGYPPLDVKLPRLQALAHRDEGRGSGFAGVERELTRKALLRETFLGFENSQRGDGHQLHLEKPLDRRPTQCSFGRRHEDRPELGAATAGQRYTSRGPS